jgi:hypothetical protein
MSAVNIGKFAFAVVGVYKKCPPPHSTTAKYLQSETYAHYNNYNTILGISYELYGIGTIVNSCGVAGVCGGHQEI